MKKLKYLKEFVDTTIGAYKIFLPPLYSSNKPHPNEHGIKERIAELEVVKSILDDPELED